MPLDPEQAWTALTARDAAHDGRFVWAVRTTGVYCRPSCPARRPLRRNVTFYADPAEAEAAGYRPCKRCAPAEGDATPAERSVQAALAYLEAHLDEPVTLARLAEHVGVSRFHLQRQFTRHVGVSPRAWVDGRRLARARAGLQAGMAVEDALCEAGFGSSRALYARSGERLGMSPGQVRRGGEGMRIRFTIVETQRGPLLVAATDRGVCAVAVATDEASEEGLRRLFPRADITRDDRAMATLVETVARHLEGGGDARAVPLDLQGTAFQLRVWDALQQIPRGQTRSYTEVAEALGVPGSVRAVASAIARNKAALLVPCHRVVHRDGTLSGYRWGVQLKQQLLELEKRP